jgi:hypothetical protein
VLNIQNVLRPKFKGSKCKHPSARADKNSPLSLPAVPAASNATELGFCSTDPSSQPGKWQMKHPQPVNSRMQDQDNRAVEGLNKAPTLHALNPSVPSLLITCNGYD